MGRKSPPDLKRPATPHPPIAAALLGVGAAASLAVNLPGHLSYDSVVQLADGRAGVYTSPHPPVMAWLLGLADSLWPGPALFVVLDTVLIAASLAALVLLGRRGGWAVVAAAGLCATIPQLLIYPAIVWKDVLFAASAVAGFATLAWAGDQWSAAGRRALLLTASVALFTLASLARQNGAIVLPFAAVAVGWMTARAGKRGWRRAGANGLAFLVAGTVAGVVATAALNTRTEAGPVTQSQWQDLQTYDIVAALTLAPATDVPVLHARAPWLERLLRGDGTRLYSPIRVDPLEPVFDAMDAHPDSPQLIAAQWRDMIERAPLLYLQVRARAFAWVLLTPDPKSCVLIYTGVDGPREEMATLKLAPRKSPVDLALARWALAFAPTPIYAHAAYGALGLGLLVWLLRRRRAPDIAVAAMIASAMAFAGSFAVISIACDYRYLYFLDLSVIAAALYAAATRNDDGDARRGKKFARLRSEPIASANVGSMAIC